MDSGLDRPGHASAYVQDTGRLAAQAAQLAREGRPGDPEGGETAAAERFEELLATLLVKELRRSIPEGLFGEGPGADIYEGWFDEHLGKSLARSLGLAEVVRESLITKSAARDAAGGQ